MKHTRIPADPANNKFFEVDEYEISLTCKGRVSHEVVDPERAIHYELFDGKRWYTVLKEVFLLWQEAYELGKIFVFENHIKE